MKVVTIRDFQDLFDATENMTNMMRMVQYDQINVKIEKIIIIEKELNVISAFSLELKKQLKLYRQRMDTIGKTPIGFENEQKYEQEEELDEEI